MNGEYKNLKTADIVAEALIDWKIEVVFGIPGDGINGFIEALRIRQDKIKFVLVRHEESAALMSCAYAKYTGKIGVCVATSGPGAIHLLNGLYDAKADNVPVIAITGSTFSDLMNSSFLQDVKLLQLFSDVASYNTMIHVPEQAEMAVDIACRTCLARKGVGHINIPIDVQEKKLSGDYSKHKVPGHTSDIFDSFALPNKKLIEKAANILNIGNKIVILVGQGALNASREVLRVAQKLNAPIIKALLGKAVVPDDHPLNLGGLGMLGTEPASEAMAETDTLLMIGTSFPYMEYLPKPGRAKGIQIDMKPEKIGLRYPVEVGLVGDSKTVLSELLPLLKNRITPKKNITDVCKNHYNNHNSKMDISAVSLQFLQSMQKSMAKWKEILKEQSNRQDMPIKPQVIAHAVSEELEENAIVSVDSGNNTVWAARFLEMRKGMKFSVSGNLATMACGLPYAIAAKIAFPDRQSVAFVGDGGFTMLMGEFATAVQYKLPIKIIILKNNLLGMIRWEQMAFLGNPEYAVEFTPIDYARFAEASGGKGFTIKKIDEVKSVLGMAMNEENEIPTIVEAYIDPFELPFPPKVNMEFPTHIAESFVRGQPYTREIDASLSMDHVPQRYKRFQSYLKQQQSKEKN
ncbi:MAG TPA: thiamine pyrophosphate-dependent enzyme [Nitrososphaeraceae archaeon]|nr:thiamine pyrophosphate-dependent enzyme [Nitrososphaeraceae archaeon]